MNTSTPSTPAPLLTAEELASIEANNTLLKSFGAYMEDMEAKNPEADFPTTLMYHSFMVGVSVFANINNNVLSRVHAELKEMATIKTMMEAESLTQENPDAPN